EPAAKLADEVFGRTVVVGEVETREAGVEMREHGGERALAVDPTVPARDLPHSGEQAADLQVGAESQAARSGQAHRERPRYSGRVWPEPPISFGTSFIFGSPSFTLSTASS